MTWYTYFRDTEFPNRSFVMILNNKGRPARIVYHGEPGFKTGRYRATTQGEVRKKPDYQAIRDYFQSR